MSRGINKVILIGNVVADPEVRYGSTGNIVANLRLAVSENWKDKTTREVMERTEFFRLVIFGKTGEIAEKYIRKGSKIYVEGRLQTRKWQDKEGADRYTTEVIVNELSLLDRPPQAEVQEPQIVNPPMPAVSVAGQVAVHAAPNPITDNWADDIPF